jgi:hypothetical protein
MPDNQQPCPGGSLRQAGIDPFYIQGREGKWPERIPLKSCLSQKSQNRLVAFAHATSQGREPQPRTG